MAEVKYFINSNNGDYIEYGETKIVFVFDGGHRVITEEEFKGMKGFLPIKKKKMDILRGRGTLLYMPQGVKSKWNKYKPTVSGGVKDVSVKTETKESVFLEIVQGLSQTRLLSEYPNSVIFWFKNGEYMFSKDLKNQSYLCSPNVWEIFEVQFNMAHHEIQAFLKIMLEKRFLGRVSEVNKATDDIVVIAENEQMEANGR